MFIREKQTLINVAMNSHTYVCVFVCVRDQAIIKYVEENTGENLSDLGVDKYY